MANPLIAMTVNDFKKLVFERLQQFRDNPRLLPSLVYARYGSNSMGLSISALAGNSKKANGVYHGSKMPSKSKPHQIHTQHRDSLVKLLEFLVFRLDLISRECLLKAPRYNISRRLYLIEMEKHTGLSRRTVQRCIGSLVRAGYIYRNITDRSILISEKLFKHLHLDISYKLRRNQLLGITKKLDKSAGKTQRPAAATHGVSHPSHRPMDKPALPSSQDKTIGSNALKGLKGMVGKSAGPPPT